MNPELIERIKACPTLPSLPSIAVQVLDLAQKADVDMSEIARLISKDPALSTKILRTVNSSFYGRSQAVSTISHALVILGLQSVKTLVLGFSLVSNLSKSKPSGFKHLWYWKRSIYSATAARVLAGRLNMVQQEEAFLCGLLMDIGMLVLDQVVNDQYGELHEKAATHSQLVELELKSLEMTHAEVGGIVAEQWQLPPMLHMPIRFHHSPENATDASLKRLTDVVSTAGYCAEVFVEATAAQAIVNVRQRCQELFKLGEADCDALLAEIGTRTKEVAGLFEINIGSAVEFEAILKKAHETLVDLTLQSQQQANRLQQQYQMLQERAMTDSLTGLSNRAHFDQFLGHRFGEAQATGRPISLIMIDIDWFKTVNDRFGHPCGDTVLKIVARLVRAAARSTDLAARYGGEELAIILPDTPRTTAVTIAETLRRALAARPVTTLSAAVSVTASFGVSSAEPGSPIKQPAHLIKAADLALYHAKNGGRNSVMVFTPKQLSAAA